MKPSPPETKQQVKQKAKQVGHFLNEFFNALWMYPRSFAMVIFHPQLWPFLAFPGFVSLAYIFLASLGFYVYFPAFSEFILRNFIPNFVYNLGFLRFFLKFIILSVALLIIVLVYKPTTLSIISPFLGRLSTSVENIQFGRQVESVDQFMYVDEAKLSAWDNWNSFGKELLCHLITFGIGFLPLGTLIATPLHFCIQAYFNGKTFIRSILQRKNYPIEKWKKFEGNHYGMFFGIGTGFLFTLAIPFFGWFFGSIISTIASTLLVADVLEKEY